MPRANANDIILRGEDLSADVRTKLHQDDAISAYMDSIGQRAVMPHDETNKLITEYQSLRDEGQKRIQSLKEEIANRIEDAIAKMAALPGSNPVPRDVFMMEVRAMHNRLCARHVRRFTATPAQDESPESITSRADLMDDIADREFAALAQSPHPHPANIGVRRHEMGMLSTELRAFDFAITAMMNGKLPEEDLTYRHQNGQAKGMRTGIMATIDTNPRAWIILMVEIRLLATVKKTLGRLQFMAPTSALTRRNQVMEGNLRLVVFVAGRLVGQSQANGRFLDLISQGNTELVNCIDNFDCSRGLKFSTYVVQCLMLKLRALLWDRPNSIHVPRCMIGKVMALKNVIAAIEEERGTPPCFDEVKEYVLGNATRYEEFVAPWKKACVNRGKDFDENTMFEEASDLMQCAINGASSFDTLVGTSGPEEGTTASGMESAVEGLWQDRDTDPMNLDQRDQALAFLGELTEREQFVIRARFGIGQPAKKLEEIAREIGPARGEPGGRVTRERIRQIQEKALKKMRRHLNRFGGR